MKTNHMKKFLSIVLALMIFAGSIPAFTIVGRAEEKNIARGAKVTAAVEDLGNRVTNMTDGNLSTYWDAGVCPSEAVVDLEGFYHIDHINVVNYFDGSRFYQYQLEYSVDGQDYEPLAAKTDNSVATKEGDDYYVDVVAWYIKIIITRNSANPSGHVNELRIYGTPEPDYKIEEKEIPTTDPEDPENIAYYKPVRTNSGQDVAMRAVDGKTSTYWIGEDIPRYIDVDLEDNYDISEIKLFPPKATGHTFSYTIYGSTDGIRFDRIGECKLRASTDSGISFPFEQPVTYRIIRVSCTSNSDAASRSSMLSELKVHGTKSTVATTPTRKAIELSSYDEWLLDNYGVDTKKLKDQNGSYDIKDTYTVDDTIAAVRGIITRNLGDEYNKWFAFEIKDGNTKLDYYEISTDADGTIRICGNNGSSLATGLNYYLKYYCFVEIAQQTVQGKMPAEAPRLANAVKRSSPYEVRYAYNYCTLSYTMAFFGYDDWQRELDYLALNGVNLILDTTATEALWVNYLQKLGYNADEAKDFVCGYAYKAWWLMGNLQGYGGPVSDQWITDTLEMARVNQRFMTVLGIQPALQAFVGMFPINFAEIASETLGDMGYDEDVASHLVDQGFWNAAYRQPMLMANTYDGYDALAQMFYESQTYLYGPVTDYYCGDLCHEGGTFPKNSTREGMSGRILHLMLDADPDAVWVLQVWGGNPTQEVLKGFGSDREDHILLLDLTAAHQTKYGANAGYGGEEFQGTSWVYCILDNYGGRYCMHGSLQKLMDTMIKAHSESLYMKGIGITPEGTQQNPIVFDLFWELAWEREVFDLDAWVKSYVHRRYGVEDELLEAAWECLLDSVYSVDTDDGMGTNAVMTNSPSLNDRGSNYEVKYDVMTAEYALDFLMAGFNSYRNCETYIYDAVELMMQYLAIANCDYYYKMKTAVEDKNVKNFELYRDKFLDTMELLDEVAGYQKDTLLGTWLGKADTWVADERTGEYDDYSLDMMRFNAGALITVWGGMPLTNYANRQYAGLLRDYYIPAWTMYLDAVTTCVKAGKGLSDLPSSNDYFALGWKLANDRDRVYTTEVNFAKGDRFSRGLDMIYKDIEANHIEYVRDNALLNIEPKRASGYKLFDGILSGVKSGTTFAELETKLEIPEGTTVSCTNSDGVLVTGDKLLLKNSDGEVVDSVLLEIAMTAEETARKNEILQELNAFLADCQSKDPAAWGNRAASVADAQLRVKYITETLRAYPIEDYENALAIVKAATAEPAVEDDDPTQPQDADHSYWWIAVVAGAVVVLGAVGVWFCVKKKKQ